MSWICYVCCDYYSPSQAASNIKNHINLAHAIGDNLSDTFLDIVAVIDEPFKLRDIFNENECKYLQDKLTYNKIDALITLRQIIDSHILNGAKQFFKIMNKKKFKNTSNICDDYIGKVVAQNLFRAIIKENNHYTVEKHEIYIQPNELLELGYKSEGKYNPELLDDFKAEINSSINLVERENRFRKLVFCTLPLFNVMEELNEAYEQWFEGQELKAPNRMNSRVGSVIIGAIEE